MLRCWFKFVPGCYFEGMFCVFVVFASNGRVLALKMVLPLICVDLPFCLFFCVVFVIVVNVVSFECVYHCGFCCVCVCVSVCLCVCVTVCCVVCDNDNK